MFVSRMGKAGVTRVAVTNHAFGTAYRGYGSPQAYTCSEALMDMLAEKAGIDPFELRYRNVAQTGDTSLNQYPFLQYPMKKMIDEGIPTRYDGKWTAISEWDEFNFMDPNTGKGNLSYAYTYALYLAEIKVDTATGKATVLSMTCVDRVGQIGNI